MTKVRQQSESFSRPKALPFVGVEKSKHKMYLWSFAFALPQCGVTLMMAPVLNVLAGIYAKYFGLSLTEIAGVMLAARVFDAVTDPVVGWLSDRDRVKSGSRKRFMLAGGVLVVPCFYFLFIPPPSVTVSYFAFWYFAFYLALTIFLIPYMAWANEFTRGGKDKALAFSALTMSSTTGGMVFYVLPMLPFFLGTEITPQVLKVTVFVGVTIFLSGLIIALMTVPDGPAAPQSLGRNNSATKKPSSMRWPVVDEMLANKPFVLFVGAFMALGIGAGMWTGMFFIFVDAYLNQGAVFAAISFWGMLVGTLSVPIWYQFAVHFGKRVSWLIGMAVLMLVFFFTGLLRPDSDGLVPLFALNMLMTFAGVSISVIALPMLCDVIDYGRLKTSTERTAAYFAVQTLLTKLQTALGASFGLGLAGWLGFTVTDAHAGGLAIIGLLLSVSWVPLVFVILAMFLVAKMPLTERRMVIVRRRLEQRAKREEGRNVSSSAAADLKGV